MPIGETSVVASADALELHAAEALTDPGIELTTLVHNSSIGSDEVVGKPNDNPIEATYNFRVEVMGANGKGADTNLEFLH